MADDTKTALRYDFSSSATRKDIFGPLVGLLDAGQRKKVAAIVDARPHFLKERCHDLADVRAFLDCLPAAGAAKDEALAVYEILACAEGQVHGCAPDAAHFHEVGDLQTVKEIAAIAQAVELASPLRISATPVQAGSGTVECEHGTLCVPAPATAAIIERFSIPVQETRLDGELCTPTSAALIARYVKEFE